VRAITAPHGEVEAADDQDQHLPGGDDGEEGGRAQHVEEVVEAEELLLEDRHEGDAQDQEDGQEAQGDELLASGARAARRVEMGFELPYRHAASRWRERMWGR
jgi:hypothetical protein